MDLFETIQKRRSIRDFTGDPIPKDDIKKIVDAGRLAPSGNNKQPWDFVVVTDKEMIQELSQAGSWSAKAGAIIAVVVNPATKYWVEDGSAAIENMLLAATALGYGSCWLQGNARPYEETFKQLLKIPQHLKLLSLIPIGFPTARPTDKQKKPLEEVIHWESY